MEIISSFHQLICFLFFIIYCLISKNLLTRFGLVQRQQHLGREESWLMSSADPDLEVILSRLVARALKVTLGF